MKSVLRSAFEPVPRPLALGTQLLVVGLLIAGIAISVVEYLEQSPPVLLVQDPASSPARLEIGPRAAAPEELGAPPKSLVRSTPRPSAPTGATATGSADRPFAGAGREPSPAGVAPMSLLPGEDG